MSYKSTQNRTLMEHSGLTEFADITDLIIIAIGTDFNPDKSG